MLIILEIANNHDGSVACGQNIIDSFSKIIQKYPQFDFAFKFQRRNLECLIHPYYVDRTDIPSIKRFKNTQLSLDDLLYLMNYARSVLPDIKIICTPFDEIAVDEIKDLGLDYIKVGSCSITDWNLLNAIVSTKLPVIASVGGIDKYSIDKVATFFKHRSVDFSLLHCVGLYPTEENEICLGRMNDLKKYDCPIGFSTHENGSKALSIALAVANGAIIIEKHIDIKNTRNAYSISPKELDNILQTIVSTQQILNTDNWKDDINVRENKQLDNFRRSAYLKQSVKAGDIITNDMLFFAIPTIDDTHIGTTVCDKYTHFIANIDMDARCPLMSNNVCIQTIREKICSIYDAVNCILQKHRLVYQNIEVEISHHYGIQRFDDVGMSVITLINKEYCKKILILLEGQKNPEHYHCKKTETFFGVHGTAIIRVDGEDHIVEAGDMLTVTPGQKHSIRTDSTTYVILEEISTKHHQDDSFYTDKTINNNKNRKTTIFI